MDNGLGLFLLAFFLALYCIPMFVAMARNHRQRMAIIVLNLLLGWTLLGWCGALVWACTNPATAVLPTAGN